MAGINKVILVGNVGRAPELKHSQDGRPFTSFSLATSRSFTGKSGEKRSETEWHHLVAWGRLAEIASSYVGKGRPIYVEGHLRTRDWQDSKGVSKTSTEIFIDTLQLLGRADDRQTKPALPIMGLNGHDERGMALAFGASSVEDHADIPF